jgi:hypothetical protein
MKRGHDGSDVPRAKKPAMTLDPARVSSMIAELSKKVGVSLPAQEFVGQNPSLVPVTGEPIVEERADVGISLEVNPYASDELKVGRRRKNISGISVLSSKDTSFQSCVPVELQLSTIWTTPSFVEWWDESVFQDGTGNILLPKLTSFVEHPPPVSCLRNQSSQVPMKVVLTKDEKRKFLREERLSKRQALRDMILTGEMQPPAPRLTMKNAFSVLGPRAISDPTFVELAVREQVLTRAAKHRQHNEGGRIPQEIKVARYWDKIADDAAKAIHVQVFFVRDFSQLKHRYKVETSARELGISGCAVMFSSEGVSAVIIAEGGHRAMGKFDGVMMRRIDWTSGSNCNNADENTRKACILCWSGEEAERHFLGFRIQDFADRMLADRFMSEHRALAFFNAALAHVSGEN